MSITNDYKFHVYAMFRRGKYTETERLMVARGWDRVEKTAG